MRVGIVIDHFDADRGGAEGWTSHFVDYLVGNGHEVHVLAQVFSAAALRSAIVPHAMPRRVGRLKLAAKVESCLKTLELDVIHDMGVGWHCDVFHSHYGSRLGQWERKDRLGSAWLRPWRNLVIHCLPRYIGLRRLCDRQYSDPNRIFLALSRMVAQDFRRHHGVRDEQIRLIYNGVDTDRFSPAHRAAHRQAVRRRLGFADDEVAFLWVGHNYALKGLATAIRAMARLARADRPVRLVVVGGRSPGKYERMARRYGIGDRLVLPGSVADTVPYYAACDAFVLPTFSDSCSLSLLEAAASGLPCVTTQFNGASELLTEGVDGFVMDDPNDDAQLAGRLNALLDPGVREAMGSAARAMALQHTFQRNCEEVEALYHEIRARKRTTA